VPDQPLIRTLGVVGLVVSIVSGLAALGALVGSSPRAALLAAGGAGLASLPVVVVLAVALSRAQRKASESWWTTAAGALVCVAVGAWVFVRSLHDSDALARFGGGVLIAAVPLSVFGAWAAVVYGRATRKRCPDCAEPISLHARVCRHCGYRYPTADGMSP
jgi:uncharacterized protein UPF0547